MMKKQRKSSRIATWSALAVLTSVSILSVAPALGQSKETQEKMRLMSSALRARDAGQLQEAKSNLEELIRISPDDPNVARLLDAVNQDLGRVQDGQTTLFGRAADVSDFSPSSTANATSDFINGSNLDAVLETELQNQQALFAQAKESYMSAG